MSLLNEDDPPVIVATVFLVFALSALLVFAFTQPAAPAPVRVQLKGVLTATEEEAAAGQFVLTSPDNPDVQLQTSDWLTEWLTGAVGRPVVLTIEAEPK